MLDELQRVQIALHDMLSQPDLKKINISKLCIEAGISRRTFYLRYGKINNCIEACIFYSKSSVINDFKQFYFEIQA